ncbi:MAG: hypothetical protein MJY47_01285 [Fibrobacter sp.]|nr:hypothetical protein [Fibrobacter sp.]
MSYCYDKYSVNCLDRGGRLYTWAAAIDSVGLANDSKNPRTCGYGKPCWLAVVKGVCPAGWHLPSKAEWDTLFTNVGGINTAGTELKSSLTEFLSWNGRNRGDSYGFSAVPAGIRLFNGNFRELGTSAYFWSSSELDEYSAYHMRLDNGESANLSNYNKSSAFSVRCIKD